MASSFWLRGIKLVFRFGEEVEAGAEDEEDDEEDFFVLLGARYEGQEDEGIGEPG